MPAPYKHVYVEKTRHGHPAVYYRKGKGIRLRLPDEIGSPEFDAAYQAIPQMLDDIVSAKVEHSVAPAANRLRGVLRSAQYRSARRGLEFAIDEQWCIDTLRAQRGRCALTGLRFSRDGTGQRGRDPYAPSLDRIDNARGYTPCNTRIVLFAVNIMLSDWGEHVFNEIVSAYRARQDEV